MIKQAEAAGVRVKVWVASTFGGFGDLPDCQVDFDR